MMIIIYMQDVLPWIIKQVRDLLLTPTGFKPMMNIGKGGVEFNDLLNNELY